MFKIDRHTNLKVHQLFFQEVVIKIEVKDNNVEHIKGFKKKTVTRWFFQIIKPKIHMKNLLKKEKNFARKHQKINKLKNRI